MEEQNEYRKVINEYLTKCEDAYKEYMNCIKNITDVDELMKASKELILVNITTQVLNEIVDTVESNKKEN